MKTLAAVSLAVSLTAGSITGASAFGGLPSAMEASIQPLRSGVEPTHFDRCHGRASGTAHHSCGTATGGPVGGLF